MCECERTHISHINLDKILLMITINGKCSGLADIGQRGLTGNKSTLGREEEVCWHLHNSLTGLAAATAKYTSNFYHQADNGKNCEVISIPKWHTWCSTEAHFWTCWTSGLCLGHVQTSHSWTGRQCFRHPPLAYCIPLCPLLAYVNKPEVLLTSKGCHY